MKLSPELNDALNAQVLHEYHNMLVYKQLESFFEKLQLKNLASYFKKQAQQEKDHGDLLVEYINSRDGGDVVLGDVDAPFAPTAISEVGKFYVGREQDTTESIESLYELALDTKSYIDLGFLQKMLDEQVEEEKLAGGFALNIGMTSDIVLFDASLGE